MAERTPRPVTLGDLVVPEPATADRAEVLHRLFTGLTRVTPTKLVYDERYVVFVVPPGERKHALGPRHHLRHKLATASGLGVEIVELADTPETQLRALFAPFQPEGLEVIDTPSGTVGHVSLPTTTRGRALGRGGQRLKLLRQLASELAGIDKVVVT